MKTILFIHGGKATEQTISQRFRLRLDWAIDYYREQQTQENITFLVSGRWGRVTDNFLMTEAELGKQYILQKLPNAKVIKEDISVEFIGNYAFSKPLLTALQPDKLIIITSKFIQRRAHYVAKKVLGKEFAYEFRFLQDELSDNPILVEKEEKALQLFKKLFAMVADGDDTASRDILLYKTPYYFKGIIDDEAFFNAYWEGGYTSYLKGINTRNSM